MRRTEKESIEDFADRGIIANSRTYELGENADANSAIKHEADLRALDAFLNGLQNDPILEEKTRLTNPTSLSDAISAAVNISEITRRANPEENAMRSIMFTSMKKCTNCTKLGHTADVCRGQTACYNCSKPGHFSKFCPNKQNRGGFSRGRSSNNNRGNYRGNQRGNFNNSSYRGRGNRQTNYRGNNFQPNFNPQNSYPPNASIVNIKRQQAINATQAFHSHEYEQAAQQHGNEPYIEQYPNARGARHAPKQGCRKNTSP